MIGQLEARYTIKRRGSGMAYVTPATAIEMVKSSKYSYVDIREKGADYAIAGREYAPGVCDDRRVKYIWFYDEDLERPTP